MTNGLQLPTQLWQGFDSFLGNVINTAVQGSASSNTNGQSTNTISVCTDTDSVSEALDVSASLSDSAFDFSAKAKASWVQSLGMTSTSVVVIVHTVVQTGVQQATGYSLNESASPYASSPQQLFNFFGDSWVNAISEGAEYYAAFIYDSSTSEQQTTISTSLKASNLSLDVSLSSTLTETATNASTTLRVNQQILGAPTLVLPNADPNDMVQFAISFPNQTFSAPTILAWALQGYERVIGVGGFGQVATNRNLLGDAYFFDVANTLATLSSQVTAIQHMYTAYGYSGDAELATKAKQIATDVDALNTLIGDIENTPTGTFTAPALPSLGYGTPIASYTLTPAMTSSDQTYDLDAAQITSGVVPLKVVLSNSGFEVTYSDDTVMTHGSLGDAKGTLTIDPPDSISEVTWVPSSYHITLIQTAQGHTASAPTESGGPVSNFNKPLPIIGFIETSPTMSPVGINVTQALWVVQSS
jgi:hypothetical protein